VGVWFAGGSVPPRRGYAVKIDRRSKWTADVWVCGCMVCWDTGLLLFRRPYSLTSFIHSASLRSFTPFASPVKSDGCAPPPPPFFCYFQVSVRVIVRLCCGWGRSPRWFIERSCRRRGAEPPAEPPAELPSQGGGTPLI
jgi:hypothetical protein